jgi:hypothetical protein
VNDEELGHALGTALAAPDMQVAPYAGARLRERARRQRTERLAVGGAAALVLVVLVAVGAVRITAALSTPSIAAAAQASPVRMLHTPLTIRMGPEAQKIKWPPCDAGSPNRRGNFCQKGPIMDVDEVAELKATDREVSVRMQPDDATMLELYTRPQQRSDLVVQVGTRSLPARYDEGVLRITTPTPARAEAFVATAGPYRPVARTGPGPLDHHLQVHRAQSSCHDSKLGLFRQVGQCLTLGTPFVSIGDADLEVHRPDRSGSGWSVSIAPTGSTRDGLARWTAAHVGEQIYYVIPDPTGKSMGYAINPATVTTVRGRMTTIEIPVPDAGAALALISRMRS